MTKVCHVTSAHSRYDPRIFHKECCSLARSDYEVTLVVADNGPDEIAGGVRITSAKFFPGGRTQRLLWASRAMTSAAVKVDADIYHLHDPELLPLAFKLKRLGMTVIFDSHENDHVKILDKQWIPRFARGSIARMFTMYESFVLSRVDAIITVSENFRGRFLSFNRNIRVVRNYPILDTAILNLDGVGTEHATVRVCYAGGITRFWLHHVAIRALPNGVRYLLAGRADRVYLQELRDLDKWNQVDYLGEVPFERVKDVYRESDIGVAFADYRSGDPSRMGTQGNTKLFEYMQAGLPVVCTDFVLWKEIVEGNECGICVDPHDVNGVFEAIQSLIRDPAKMREMGANGRRAVLKEYNWGAEERELLALYAELVSARISANDE